MFEKFKKRWFQEWGEQKTQIEICAAALYQALTRALTNERGIHVEDLISVAAAIVGEACIETAGDFNPRNHDFVPGQRVFSTNANALFCDDKDLSAAPAGSIVGILRDKLLGDGFIQTDFPSLNDIFSHFAASVGKLEDWGKVPLSIPKEHHPFVMPLRAAYEMRSTVDSVFAPLGNNPREKLHAATLTLAETLWQTRDVLDRQTAIKLALETVNGMAKTAPMTDAAMAKAKAEHRGDTP